MPTEWTLEDIKRLCERQTLTFFSEMHPGIRVQGIQFRDTTPGLTPNEAQHLRGQVVEFRSAATMTQDPVVAWALLHAPKWLAIVPGSWHAAPPPWAGESNAPVIKAERTKRAKK